VFENGSETIHDVEGTLVSKNTGIVANNQQPAECVTCCRDHTDPSTLPVDGVGETISYGTTNYDASSDYPEACRMKYINGKLRVYQDWSLKTVTVFADDYVSDAEVATQTLYKNYVVSYVKDDSTTKANLTGRDLSILQGGNQQLLARTIYLDTVYNASGSTPSYATFLAGKVTDGDTDVLQFIPFFEVNLTKLANWTDTNCTTSGGTGACTTSEAIVDEGLTENNYSRGLVTVAVTADDVAPATSDMTARLNAGNSGVVGNADDGTNTGEADRLRVTVADSSSVYDITIEVTLCSITGPGNGARKDALFDLVELSGNVRYSGGSSASCSLTSSSNNDRIFTCSSIPNADTVTVAVSGPTTVAYNTNNVDITAATTAQVDVEVCDY